MRSGAALASESLGIAIVRPRRLPILTDIQHQHHFDYLLQFAVVGLVYQGHRSARREELSRYAPTVTSERYRQLTFTRIPTLIQALITPPVSLRPKQSVANLSRESER